MDNHNDFKNAKFSAIKGAVIEGMESGFSDETIPDIMKEVEIRMEKNKRI